VCGKYARLKGFGLSGCHGKVVCYRLRFQGGIVSEPGMKSKLCGQAKIARIGT
jgi:hypothetical protein